MSGNNCKKIDKIIKLTQIDNWLASLTFRFIYFTFVFLQIFYIARLLFFCKVENYPNACLVSRAEFRQ